MTENKINMFAWVAEKHWRMKELSLVMPLKKGKPVTYQTLYHNFRRAKLEGKSPSENRCLAIAEGMSNYLGRKVRAEDLIFTPLREQ